MRLRALLVILLLWFAPAQAVERCGRLVAVGDLHGGYDAFIEILTETRLINKQKQWIGGAACLVQTGDVVDRGDRSREILELLIGLRKQQPERVHMLLGNHEVMNLVGDLRYLSNEEIADFAGQEIPTVREQGFEDFLETPAAQGLEAAPARAAFDRLYPPGWFARRQAFGPAGRYGKWLLEQPVALILKDSFFAHAGMNAVDARRGVAWVNQVVPKQIREFHRQREILVDAGWIHPLGSYAESFAEVQEALDSAQRQGSGGRDRRTQNAARKFLALRDADYMRDDGPLWYRELADADESAFRSELEDILGRLEVERLVIGHTPQNNSTIRARFDGRVFLIDTGAGPTYGGRVSALEIAPDGTVYAIYRGKRELLYPKKAAAVRIRPGVVPRGEVLLASFRRAAADDSAGAEGPPTDDAAIERILLQGKVVESKEIGSGVSRPLKLLIELDGVQVKAAFKKIDEVRMGKTSFDGGPPVYNFTDRYIYERAAYLLDRYLGIGMVPPTVLRNVDGSDGAVTAWVSGAVTEGERTEKNLAPPNALYLTYQRHIMYLFDALIANTDRNLGNQLTTTADWRLHLIDHSRTFRMTKKLDKNIEKGALTLPRSLYDKLKAMQEPELTELFGDLLSKRQIKSMLVRRDQLIEKIDADRESNGDALVFQDEMPGARGPEALND